jgi:hypothetical protein
VQFAATGMIRHNVYFRRSSATYGAFLREEVISIFQEAERRKLWARWNGRLAGNPFVQRQLASAARVN